MGTFNAGDGDIDYLKLIAQNLGDNVVQFQLFRQQLYDLIGTLKIKNGVGDFTFQSVATATDFTTPTKPAFGYAQDTGIFYVYSLVEAAWIKIGLVLP